MYFLCIILTAILAVGGHLTLADGDKFLLDGRSFALTSIISVLSGENKLVRQVHLIEKYSIEQQRAFLQYQVPSSLMNADFYHDASTDISLFLSRKFRSCAASSVVYMYQNLLLDERPVLNLFKQVDADVGSQLGHNIIGPARLLFYATIRAKSLKRIANDKSDGPLVEYNLELKLNSTAKYKDTAKLSLTFTGSRLSHVEAPPLEESLPKHLIVSFVNSSARISIRYLHHEILAPIDQVGAKADLNEMNNEVVVDQFAFPPSLDCAQYMERAGRLDLFEGFDLNAPVRFSFNALTKPILGRPHQHFVAFDGTTQSMRIDSDHSSSNKSPGSRSKQVLDLRTNRKYVVAEGVVTPDRSLDDKLDQPSTHCSATYLFNLDKSERKTPTLSGFLLGGERFNYMGRAQVRGIKARIYETTSNGLPYWFSQPLLYIDVRGEQRYRVRGIPAREQKPAAQPAGMNRYSVVVYVAEDSDGATGLRVLLLEVYDRTVFKTSAFRRVLSAHLFDFMWELNEAPNGDSVEELFALYDTCSAGGGRDRYADLELLLEQEQQQGESNIPDTQTETWLKSPSKRRTALNAAIRDTLNLQTTLIYDLETKYSDKSLRASFKVAEHPKILYSLTFVGNARIFRKSMTVKAINAESLTECLSIVDTSEQKYLEQIPVYLFFSEATSICVLESNETRQTNSIIEMNSYETGELFKLEPLRDREIEFRNSWLSDDAKANQLQQRPIVLRNLQYNFIQPLAPDEVKMRIRNIKLKNFNYNVAEDKGEEAPTTMLPGFSFDISEASISSTTNEGNVQQINVASKELCKAACLATSTCNSFSYCTSNAHCHLSTYNLTSVSVRNQLTAPELQRLKRNSKVIVRLGNGEILELRRDIRCDLYNKIHMDLFRNGLPARTSLSRLEIQRVDEVEQCAKLCFNRSLAAIQHTSELGEQIDLLLALAEDDPTHQHEALQQLHQDFRKAMTNFCSYFLYLESWLTDEQQQKLDAITVVNSTTVGKGYCALENLTNKQSTKVGNSSIKVADSDEINFLFDSYRFDFTTLYEKKYGFGLQRTPLDHGEMVAYHSLTQFNRTTELEFAILREAVEDGKNFQLELMADPLSCAQQCFAQSSGLWPSCGSFDTITVHYDWGSSTRCHLNSLVSSQRILEPEAFEPQKAHLWHYEPRFGYARQMLDEMTELETETNEQPVIPTNSGVIDVLTICSVVIFSIVSGFTLSVVISRRIIRVAGLSNEDNLPLDRIALPLS